MNLKSKIDLDMTNMISYFKTEIAKLKGVSIDRVR